MHTTRLIFALALILGAGCKPQRGAVIDRASGKGIAEATIVHAGQTVHSDPAGEFVLRKLDPAQPLLLKAPGYRGRSVKVAEQRVLKAELEPFEVRGVYLSYTALGQPEVRDRVLGWLGSERLNTLVVEIKEERGRMTFYNGAPGAGQMGAFGAVKIENILSFLEERHRQGVYVVGCISVFKDSVLAEHNPGWAVESKGRPSLFWLDPYCQEVWNYNLVIAKEAAGDGFDEIQFDNVRFPEPWEVPQAQYRRRDTPARRASALAGFWQAVQRELAPYNTCVSVGGPSARGPGMAWNATSGGPDYLAPPPGAAGTWVGAFGDPARTGKRLRPYVTCGFGLANRNLPAAVATYRASGASGWVVYDPAGKYELPEEVVHTLKAKED